MLHTEVLTPAAVQLAPLLCRALTATNATLAGGTALALQIGHRVSVDFDWFFPAPAIPADGAARLAALDPGMQVIQDANDTLECVLTGVKVSLFAFRPTFSLPQARLHSLPLATIEDIAAMKVIAIGQRGARKDFYDLFEILQSLEFSTVARRVRDMYRHAALNPVHLAKSLVYFRDAERDPEPVMLKSRSWRTVTLFFSNQTRQHTDILLEVLQG